MADMGNFGAGKTQGSGSPTGKFYEIPKGGGSNPMSKLGTSNSGKIYGQSSGKKASGSGSATNQFPKMQPTKNAVKPPSGGRSIPSTGGTVSKSVKAPKVTKGVDIKSNGGGFPKMVK